MWPTTTWWEHCFILSINCILRSLETVLKNRVSRKHIFYIRGDKVMGDKVTLFFGKWGTNLHFCFIMWEKISMHLQ